METDPQTNEGLLYVTNVRSLFLHVKQKKKKNNSWDTTMLSRRGSSPPLRFSQGVDYEKNKIIDLEIMARNEAELTGTTAQWNTIPVKVAVDDVDEGPEFTAPTIRFHVKENTPNGTVIGSYTAIDPETKTSDRIRLVSVTQRLRWLNDNNNNKALCLLCNALPYHRRADYYC